MTQEKHDVALSSGGKESLFIQSRSTNNLSQQEHAEIARKILLLIGKFKQLSPDEFKTECQRAIDEHGFTVFRDVFDEVLIDKSSKKNFWGKSKVDRHAPAFSAINNYLVDRFTSTITQIASKGAKLQAEILLYVMDADPASLREQAQVMATQSNPPYQEVKDKALDRIKIETAAQIRDIQKEKLTEQEKADAIAKIQESAKMKSDAIATSSTMPIDYYVQKIHQKILDKYRNAYAPICAEQMEVINRYVRQDILSKTSIDERSLALERYVLMTKKMVDAGNVNTAVTIFGALMSQEVYRLKATKGSLSAEAQTIYEQLEHGDLKQLFDSKVTHALQEYCKKHDAFIPPHLIFGMIELARTAGILVKTDGTIAINEAFHIAHKNSLLIQEAPITTDVDVGLHEEIYRGFYDLRSFPEPENNPETFKEMCKQRELSNRALERDLDQISRIYEPRGVLIKPSKAVQRIDSIKVSQETPSSTHSDFKSLKASLQQDKAESRHAADTEEIRAPDMRS